MVEEQLKVAQERVPDADMLELCSSLAADLNELHRLEESYWYARSRSNEL